MKLFQIENHSPTPTAELLLIPEFKTLWVRDKSKDKAKALGELAYVYFSTDYLSNYVAFTKDVKEERLAEDFLGGVGNKPDAEILKACKKYDELQQTPTMNFLKAAKAAMQSTEDYFNQIDYSERDGKGNPVYKIKEITSSLKDCSGIKDTIDKLEAAVKKEMTNGSVARGGGAGGLLEFEVE